MSKYLPYINKTMSENIVLEQKVQNFEESQFPAASSIDEIR